MLAADEHVLIVGAGTFGLSTAVELLRKGHKNLTLLDAYPIPSLISAGNDVNKVFQSTVEDKFDSELALVSMEKWKTDPLYKPAFHEVGIIYGATGDSLEEIDYRKLQLKMLGKKFQELNTPEDFARLIRCDTSEGLSKLSLEDDKRFLNWKGYFQETDCGWTFASLALQNVGAECVKLGAKVIVDQADSLIYQDGKCIGVKTFSGELIYAKKTVICAGANSVRFLDFKNQLLAKCWTVGHIQLTDEEALLLKDSPVVLSLDEGFFFEPDKDNHLKFCNEFPGYINMEQIATNEGPVSVPTYRSEVPKEAEDQMRGFLRQVFPQFAERPFCVSKICWCTDTPERNFLFCDHPEIEGLVLGTGDSGKGFKYMPIVGEYISEIVLKGDSALDDEKRKKWAWIPVAERDNYALQGRVGGSNVIKDLKDIESWTDGQSV